MRLEHHNDKFFITMDSTLEVETNAEGVETEFLMALGCDETQCTTSSIPGLLQPLMIAIAGSKPES